MKLCILSLLIALSLVSAAQAANCPNGVRVRKDYRDMSEQEWAAFIKAINNLRNARNGNVSKFESFTKLHADFMSEAHADANFGWWHRIYLKEYEDALVAANPEFKALPFWDWSADYALPHKASIFEPKYLGGSSADGVTGAQCVPDGPFANAQLSFPDRKCLSRGFSRSTGRSSAYPNQRGQVRFYSPAELTQLMNSQSSFDNFHETLQYAVHSTPHAYIGGVGGEMYYISRAPNDPIFTMHHVYIDSLLDLWQARHPGNTRYNDATYRAFNGVRASSVFKLDETCVKYEPFSGFNKPKPPPNTTTTAKSTTTSAKSTTFSSSSVSSSLTSASQSASASASTTTTTTTTRGSTSASSSVMQDSTTATSSAVPTTTSSASTGSSSTASSTTSGSSSASSSTTPTTTSTGTSASQTSTATGTSSGSAKPTQTADPYKPNKEQSEYYKDTFYGKSPACPYLPPPDSYLPPPPAKFVEENMYPKERVQASVERMEKVAEEVKKQADQGVYLPPAVPATAVMVDQSAGNGDGSSSSAPRAVVASAGPAAAVAVVVALLAL